MSSSADRGSSSVYHRGSNSASHTSLASQNEEDIENTTRNTGNLSSAPTTTGGTTASTTTTRRARRRTPTTTTATIPNKPQHKTKNRSRKAATSSHPPTITSSSSKTRAFVVLLMAGLAVFGSVQTILHFLLFRHNSAAPPSSDVEQQRIAKQASLQTQLSALQSQVQSIQASTQTFSKTNLYFYPFSIRDSRRLVPTQLDAQFHIWDYVDISSQNQQATKHASLFLDGHLQALAVCQTYDLYCYKKKIQQVFSLVLQQNPHTQYFFYMEADNELCVSMQSIQDLALESQRYFITTGIGFSGWIMRRDFVVDFLHLLHDFVPQPRDPKDILNQQGRPPPSEGPDPIAADFLMQHQSWAVTRQYLVSHSIQPSLGQDALTVRMPNSDTDNTLPVNQTAAQQKKKKSLEKHLPRCLEPRRSKWRISKQDHRDRFGWDYFDYLECDGPVFPCYDGQLQDLLARDMARFNYTQLDLDRQVLIRKQQDRERKKLLKAKAAAAAAAGGGGQDSGSVNDNAAGVLQPESLLRQNGALAQRLKEINARHELAQAALRGHPKT